MVNFKYWLINIVALNLLLLDISLKKIFSTSNLPAQAGGEYFIFGDFLKLKLTVNSGVAFGLGLDYSLIVLMYCIIIPILIFILFNQYKQKKYFNIFGLTFIILGALSNLIDRIFFGAVIDYIDLKYYSVFNLADVMIVFGVIIMIIVELRGDNHFKKY